MSITVTILCPLDGLALTTKAAARIGDLADVDGDFLRDATQHVHYEAIDSVVECLNGHRWRFKMDPVLERVDPLKPDVLK